MMSGAAPCPAIRGDVVVGRNAERADRHHARRRLRLVGDRLAGALYADQRLGQRHPLGVADRSPVAARAGLVGPPRAVLAGAIVGDREIEPGRDVVQARSGDALDLLLRKMANFCVRWRTSGM